MVGCFVVRSGYEDTTACQPVPEVNLRMSFNVDTEKGKFRVQAKISSDTYATDGEIGKRTRHIFRTFARVLAGRSDLPKNKKEAEMGNLLDVLRREVVHPLLSPHNGYRIVHWNQFFSQTADRTLYCCYSMYQGYLPYLHQ